MKRVMLSAALFASITPFAMANDPYEDFETTYLESIPTEAFAWARTGVTNYAFAFTRYCFCPNSGTTYEINVRNNNVVSARNTDTGEMVEQEQLDYYPTVDELHLQLLKQNNKAHKITAEYNSRWHYPTKVYVDIHPMMADEEISYEIPFLAPIMASGVRD